MKTKLKKSKKTKPKYDEVDPLAGDLSDFIQEGGWFPVQFELREKKDKVLSVRLSEKLLNEIKTQAKASGLDTQKFVRIILETSLHKKAV